MSGAGCSVFGTDLRYPDGGTRVTTDKRKGRRVRPYSTSEAAKELGVSQRTVIRWCEAGLIEFFWTPRHGQRRIPVRALEKYRERIP